MDGTAFAIATALVVYASLTGNGQALCDAMGGTYTPQNVQTNTDVCPGGKWSNLVLPKPTQQK